MGPYAYLRDQWVSFDDIDMIKHKSEYIKAMGLGGGMIWALDLDDFKNYCTCEEYPLLKTINRVLRGYPGPQPDCPLEMSATRDTAAAAEAAVTQQPNNMACDGKIFAADYNDCNKYYLCNQGQLQQQSCPAGLYWNENHCDWPENSACHPDKVPQQTTTTQRPIVDVDKVVTVTTTTMKPSKPGTDTSINQIPGNDNTYKVVCYFTNWAWYRQGDGKYKPEDIDTDLCTHITYGFAVLDSNTLTIKPHDSWADIDNGKYIHSYIFQLFNLI